MTNEEREGLIKELRIVVLDDINKALVRVIGRLPSEDARRQAAEAISYHLTQVASEIGRDELPRVHVNL